VDFDQAGILELGDGLLDTGALEAGIGGQESDAGPAQTAGVAGALGERVEDQLGGGWHL
jgi:hypothetical protein